MVSALIRSSWRQWGPACVALSIMVAAVWYWDISMQKSLAPASNLTGWLLLTLIVYLLAFNVRKKISVIPLGSAKTWMRWHIWIAFLALAVFGFHIRWQVPRGGLEVTLALIFAFTFLSGVLGLFLTVTIPTRLARHNETLIFERIPQFTNNLRRDAQQLVLDSIDGTHSTTIAEFFHRRLAHYFEGPRNRWSHLLGSYRVQFMLNREFRHVKPFLDDTEQTILAKLKTLTDEKHKLDVQHAGLWALRTWLFIHIPLSYSLIVLAGLHVALVLAFNAGGL